jgi:hypothetical protein
MTSGPYDPPKFYRVYVLSDDGHAEGPAQELTCGSDAEAVVQARALAAGRAVEVWERDRMVVRLRRRRGRS